MPAAAERRPQSPSSLVHHVPPVADATEAEEADDEQQGQQAQSGSSSGRRRGHFANVLKGFVGSNFLAIPFAFTASGVLLGPLAIAAIAGISGYGCLLLVRIRRDLQRRRRAASSSSGPPPSQHQQQQRSLETYPQVAGAVLGKWGLVVVELALVLTQFG